MPDDVYTRAILVVVVWVLCAVATLFGKLGKGGFAFVSLVVACAMIYLLGQMAFPEMYQSSSK
jgi:cytochrome bd-type quinol oxidase subunit 2